MLFKIMLAMMGYYFGRSGMSLGDFLALAESVIRRLEDK